MTITTEMSDLFFNHEHPTYEGLFLEASKFKEEINTDQIRTAILVDAENFMQTYPMTCGFHGLTSAQELADDFMVRL